MTWSIMNPATSLPGFFIENPSRVSVPLGTAKTTSSTCHISSVTSWARSVEWPWFPLSGHSHILPQRP
jgi:hypothetical protein